MTLREWLAQYFHRPPKPPPPPTEPVPITPPVLPPADYRAQLVQFHNSFRKSHGLAPLVYHSALEASAQRFASDLAAHPAILSSSTPHNGSDGSRFQDRILEAGYRWSAVAENAAQGSTAIQVEQMWEGHPPHAQNILGPYRHMGVGRAGNMWVVDFGAPL